MVQFPNVTTRFSLTEPPIAKFIGFQITQAGDGKSVVDFEADERHANPMGTLHGGILCDIADVAMGVALWTTLQPGETFTTLELKINFLKPFWTGKLQALGRIVKAGKTISLVECDVVDSEQKLVARAVSTCMTLRDEKAAGR
jgi:uncharacterized protein (TIGR00369 family)